MANPQHAQYLNKMHLWQYVLQWKNEGYDLLRLTIYLIIIAGMALLHYHIRPPFWVQLTRHPYFGLWLYFSALVAGVAVEICFRPQYRFTWLPLLCTMMVVVALFYAKARLPVNNIVEALHLSRVWEMPVHWVGGTFLMLSAHPLFHWVYEKQPGFYLMRKPLAFKPYLTLILWMLPFLLLAAATPSMQQFYPRAGMVSLASGSTTARIIGYIIFEVAYLFDFFTIEMFFRGLLVGLLAKYLGQHCILPIALFYFAVHLGKPALEAVSSFVGGALLGINAYYTQSIWGGWVVHAGIALLMELFTTLL